MASKAQGRWRPPNPDRSLSSYKRFAWVRLCLYALLLVLGVVSILQGQGAALLIPAAVVVLLAGSMDIWRLQGIHALEAERRTSPAAPAEQPPTH